MDRLILLILLFISHSLFSQSCIPDGILFQSQQEIDDFPINYPGCTEIEGTIVLSGDFSNLQGLSEITSIGRDLQIYGNTMATDFPV